MSTGAHRTKKKKSSKHWSLSWITREKDSAQVSGLCSILSHLFFLAILSVCTPDELKRQVPHWSVLYLTSPVHSSPAFPIQASRQCLHILFTCSPREDSYATALSIWLWAQDIGDTSQQLFCLLSLVFWRLLSPRLSISHGSNLLLQNVLLLARNLQISKELDKQKGRWVWSQYWR